MKDKFNKILIRYRPQLVDEMDCTELLNLLISRNILTRRQAKSISCIVDPYKQNEAVIDALHRRPDEDFDSFCEALIETKQKHIVDNYLRPSSTPDITSAVHLETLGIQLRGVSETRVKEQVMVQETVENVAERPADLQTAATNTPPPQPEPGESESDWRRAGCPLHIDNITVVPSTAEFYQNNKDQSYPMSRPCRGKLLLICNDEFRGGPSLDSGGGQQALPSERLGADTDVDNISTLFRRLQFDIVYHNNLTAAEMLSVTSDVAGDLKSSDDDCFALCVMSHGQLQTMRAADGDPVRCECVLGTDGVAVPTASLLAPFCNEKCPPLRGKPRIVIFQACRGDSVDRTHSDCVAERCDSAAVVMTDAQPSSLQHDLLLSFKDFIIGYPTQTGFRSFRNTSIGSWYLNALTRVFAERSCNTDVAAMLRLVNECVSGWVSNSPGNSKLYKGSQCASIHDNLTRAHLYLFPGISTPTTT